jgi:NADH oxidase (H2O2-forming)
MKEYDVLVIGGSAAGIAAVHTARKHYPDLSVSLIRMEEKVPVPCAIPYVFGTLGSSDLNLISDQAVVGKGADLILDEVTEIHPDNHVVTTAKGEEVKYKKLILAIGSTPIRLPLPGHDLEGVYTVPKDVPYLDNLHALLKTGAKDVVIIGGGFIGVEVGDEINKMEGINVTIVEILPHCLELAFDPEFCSQAEEALNASGINVVTEKSAKAILGEDGKATAVELSDGSKIKADLVIFGIGARARTDLAEKAGLEIDSTKSIAVDSRQVTSHPDIFAIGDCAGKKSFFDGEPSRLKLASIASFEARIAGANILEDRRENPGVIGAFATKIGDTYLAGSGMTENLAKKAGTDYVIGINETATRHPGSMPGSTKRKVKLMFRKSDGVIIGGQVTGGSDSAEVNNIISAMISGKFTADQIALFQLGTHPAQTPSPIPYHLVVCADAASVALKK